VREGESSGLLTHLGTGTCVSLSGPVPPPLSQWLWDVFPTSSTTQTRCHSDLDARPALEEAALLIELSMVEQRNLAVREVLDSGATITQVATQYGVDRRTLHRWLTCYANGGLETMADRSSRPESSPTQMIPHIVARERFAREVIPLVRREVTESY
jgi:transposase-like protein